MTMPIKKLVVTDQNDVEHVFEGDGFLQSVAAMEKTAGMAKIVGQQITASVTVKP